MKREDFPKCKIEYSQECPCCELKMCVYADKYNDPEYEYEVYVQCQCGEFLEFILPVN